MSTIAELAAPKVGRKLLETQFQLLSAYITQSETANPRGIDQFSSAKQVVQGGS